jgi:FkbM family methyltransferase
MHPKLLFASIPLISESLENLLGGEFTPLLDFCDSSFDGLIVDAGGYIGTAALALHQAFPKARIVTIEPSSDNFRLLQRNTLHVKSIYPIRAALVAGTSTKLTLSNRGTGPWGYTIVDEPSDSPEAPFIEEVPSITLHQISEMFRADIGILKLDIEGGEHDLFTEGAPDLALVPVIFAELHDRIVPGCTSLFNEFSKDRQIGKLGGEKYISVSKQVSLNLDVEKVH